MIIDSFSFFLSREQKKTLAALEMELSAARQQGFVPKHTDGAETKKRPLVVIGIMTSLGNKKKRDAVRQAWMGTGKLPPPYSFSLSLISTIRLCASVCTFFFFLKMTLSSFFTCCRCIIKEN